MKAIFVCVAICATAVLSQRVSPTTRRSTNADADYYGPPVSVHGPAGFTPHGPAGFTPHGPAGL